MGGGRESNDVVFHVMVRVPSPTAVQEKVVVPPNASAESVGDVVKTGVVAIDRNENE